MATHGTTSCIPPGVKDSSLEFSRAITQLQAKIFREAQPPNLPIAVDTDGGAGGHPGFRGGGQRSNGRKIGFQGDQQEWRDQCIRKAALVWTGRGAASVAVAAGGQY